MFKTLLSYFWSNDDNDTEVENAYSVLENLQKEETKDEEKSSVVEEEQQSCILSHKNGVVTFAENDTYIIDDIYKFESDSIDLKKGMKVSFVAYYSEGKINITHVKINDSDWDSPIDETIKSSWCCRSMITKVVKRENRKLFISPGDFIIDLNKVTSEFVPIVGDWLDLEVKVEVDTNVTDLFGKILEVTVVRPLRLRVVQGVINKWDQDDGIGAIDNKIFFNAESLVGGGYTPVLKDRVITEAIESDQGMYIWRSLKVLPQNDPKKSLELLDKKTDYVFQVKEVRISEDFCLNVSKTNVAYKFTFDIKNETNNILHLLDVYFANKNDLFKVTNPSYNNLKIDPYQNIKIECKCFVRSTISNLILFQFENFKIGRQINFICQKTAENYERAKNIHGNNLLLQARMFKNRKSTDIIPGQKVSLPPRFISARLPEYPVQEKLLNIILKYNTLMETAELNEDLTLAIPCLKMPLTFNIYENKFHTLLHLEEIYNLIAIRTYDQDAACFIRDGEFLLLEIENLSEKRPSIIIGDKIIITDSYKVDNVSYEGYVHKVGAKHLYIKFSSTFHENYNGEDYSVRVINSRTQYRRLHQAVGLVMRNVGPSVLFPSKVVEKLPQLKFHYDKYDDIISTTDKKLKNRNELLIDVENAQNKKTQLLLHENDKEKVKTFTNRIFKLEWFNKSLNYYQREAVRNVLSGVVRPLPYIIFGPPGTGKTITLIEIILQILRMIPHCRLLVAAPSNSAADLLASRLIDSGVLKPGDLVRLVAYTRIVDNLVPPKLIPYSATIDLAKEGTRECQFKMTREGVALGCSSAVIGRHRITVGTCSVLSGLFALGFSKGHFTHIIVDEAGQATEPDVMIPLSFLDVNTGQVILAGDHMQLGPVILFNIALTHGLGESFLERLINRFPYVRDITGFPNTNGYDPRLVTKLIYNYRSLPELLTLPNSLFYNGELKPTISPENSEEADLLHKLKEILPQRENKSPPSLVFHGVLGENYQTPDSPSWYNPNEVSQVFLYVNELYRLGFSCEQIGIITLYVKQVKEIRNLFNEAEFELPKIGTVEEFQGREFHVILLSLVKSEKNNIDFLCNPKRMNVALTRSQLLTIVIGNPYAVANDFYWRKVIKFCVEQGAYTGCDFELTSN